MMNFNSIKFKIILLSTVSAFLIVFVFLLVIIIQKDNANEKVTVETKKMLKQNLSLISRNIYYQTETLHEILLSEVHNGLKVAWKILNIAGTVSIDNNSYIKWEAVNQFTKSKKNISMPKMRIGSKLIQKNTSFDKESPFVDEISNLVGGTATIFQRINEAGDMLRICTSVRKLDDTRAIGTYIPVINPDGTKNTVIDSVLSGHTYIGSAFVVNSWYLTAYEPIYDYKKTIVGVLYYGIRQEKTKALRNSILQTRFGKTGHVYVLNAKGNSKGNYVISEDSARDGENILDAEDSSGKSFIKSIIQKAENLNKDEVSFETYSVKEDGGQSARMKTVAITYFEPWDWIIAAEAFDDDYNDVNNKIESAINSITAWGSIIALIILAGVIFGSLIVTNRITDPVKKILSLAHNLTKGDLDLTKRLHLDSRDEVGQLAFKINEFIDSIHKVVVQVTNGTEYLTRSIQEIAESNQDMSQRTSEQAASLEEIRSKVEETTSAIALNADNIQEVSNLSGKNRLLTDTGTEVVEETRQAIDEINQSSKQIADIIITINEIAFQTNLLALNASVEAARAGEQGRGFAVVAGEVRNLAQRAANASKDIEKLISNSSEKVEKGLKLSSRNEEVFKEIKESINEINKRIKEVSATSQEQKESVILINNAISEIESMTQQNASIIEETASASEEMSSQSMDLLAIVEKFKIDKDCSANSGNNLNTHINENMDN
ncbi:MAG: Cache 3/Cache 2 fusion domain-containing protein [Spirochaetes bacterium]|nr:Cache 3/Cache 2 fusion domain-containing protein [Spirochaetota bacterium]